MTNEDAIKHIKFALIDGYYELPRATALEALLLAIDALANQPRWIPVTERLPDETYKTYLVSVDYGKHGKAVMSLFWYNEEFGWDNGFNDSVVAWMPLPEPYTKEETK